jgi:hypothetical protein
MMFGAGMLAGVASILAQACSGSDFSSGTRNSSKGNANKKPGAPTGTATSDGEENDVDAADPDSAASADADDAAGVDASGTDSADANGEGLSDADDGLADAGADADGGSDAGAVDGTNDTNDGNLDSGDDTDECFANTTPQLDVDKLPKADDAQVPAVRFYGKDGSAMVAMKFATGAGIQQVIVCKEDGKLLALHGMTGADNGGARPIVIDNIILTGVANLKLVIQMDGGKRVVATVPKAYFKTFNNVAVTDLSDSPNPTDQSVAQFAEEGGSFTVDANVSYPKDSGPNDVRNLQTVNATSKWTRGAGVKGTVTDIMGDTIDIKDSAIIEHPTFCTYASGGFRTMIRIG